MKKLTLIFTLLFSTVMFSSPSYAKWTRVSTVEGVLETFYLDYERVRKVDGYVYYWVLSDLLNPTEEGYLSRTMYLQNDCKLFRGKILNYNHHKEQMGKGTLVKRPVPIKDKGWNYPPPNSIYEYALKKVCGR